MKRGTVVKYILIFNVKLNIIFNNYSITRDVSG